MRSNNLLFLLFLLFLRLPINLPLFYGVVFCLTACPQKKMAFYEAFFALQGFYKNTCFPFSPLYGPSSGLFFGNAALSVNFCRLFYSAGV